MSIDLLTLHANLSQLTVELQRAVEEFEKENNVELSAIDLRRIDVSMHSDEFLRSTPRISCEIRIRKEK